MYIHIHIQLIVDYKSAYYLIVFSQKITNLYTFYLYYILYGVVNIMVIKCK